MARRFYTVFVLPRTHNRFRKLYLSKNFVVVGGIVAGVLLVAGLLTPHFMLELGVSERRLAALAAENERLREEGQRFEQMLAEVGHRLGEFEQRTAVLAEAVGVDPAADSEAAAGGPASGSSRSAGVFDDELEGMAVRADSLAGSLLAVEQAWQDHELLMASTPNTLPVRGWFSDGYGWRNDPIHGKREFHKGLDIVAQEGAVIRAPADGVVTRAGRDAGYGRMIDLSHGFGYATRYGHLSELLVEPGQRVRRGDAVGRVGSTGHSTGPHLHYEVFKDGRRVNPWMYVGDGEG